ncbi:MAG: shikimate kinase [Gammaproteobacteria bacterium]
MSRNITLIGMAGSGKTTIGSIIAHKLGKEFIDSDKLIEDKYKSPLQRILESNGYLKLREIESEVIQNIDMNNVVLATGGSAVYSPNAMNHLATQSSIIYLKVPLSIIFKRVDDFGNRGFAKHPEQSIEEVYKERSLLYESFANITIENISSTESCVEEIIMQLK